MHPFCCRAARRRPPTSPTPPRRSARHRPTHCRPLCPPPVPTGPPADALPLPQRPLAVGRAPGPDPLHQHLGWAPISCFPPFTFKSAAAGADGHLCGGQAGGGPSPWTSPPTSTPRVGSRLLTLHDGARLHPGPPASPQPAPQLVPSPLPITPAAIRVPETYTVERAYILFSTMGLRHLVVVDEHNRVRVRAGNHAGCAECPAPPPLPPLLAASAAGCAGRRISHGHLTGAPPVHHTGAPPIL